MELSRICGDIKKREIILYGEQEEIIQFLEKYCDLLKISTVISEYNNEIRLQPYSDWDIKTVLFDNVKFDEKQMTIICSKNKFNILRRRLEYLGKKEYQDYISCELVEHVLSGKKLMVCMGTQLVGQVSLLIQAHQPLMEQYSLIFFSEQEIMEPYLNRMQEYIHVCRCCAVYVRSACEKEKFLLKTLDRETLRESCEIITIADYGFGGYYPQIIRDRERVNDYLLRGYMRLPIDYHTLAFASTDKEILKLCEQGIPEDDIVDKLVNDNFYSEKTVTQNFSEEIERLKQLESTTDIRLSRFVKEHETEYLCRNLYEWSEVVVSYIANSILEHLNMPFLSAGQGIQAALIEENSGSELPVYPSVQKALNLEEELKHKKYRVVTYSKVRYLALEEYLYTVIEYLYKAMDIMKFSGMDGEQIFWPDEKANR